MYVEVDRDKLSFEHINYNLLCAISIETSGDDPFYHDVVQICIMPIDVHCKRMKAIDPFFIDLQPKHLDRIDENTMSVTREKILFNSKHGLNWITGAEILEEWFDKLLLPNKKQILPLAYQWHKIVPYLYNWLGKNTFNYIFSDYARDVQSDALFANDYHYLHIENVPYVLCDFSYLCNLAKVERQNRSNKDSMTECLALIDLYRSMCNVRTKL